MCSDTILYYYKSNIFYSNLLRGPSTLNSQVDHLWWHLKPSYPAKFQLSHSYALVCWLGLLGLALNTSQNQHYFHLSLQGSKWCISQPTTYFLNLCTLLVPYNTLLLLYLSNFSYEFNYFYKSPDLFFFYQLHLTISLHDIYMTRRNCYSFTNNVAFQIDCNGPKHPESWNTK